MTRSAAVQRTASLNDPVFQGLADRHARTPLQALLDRESRSDRHRHMNIDACLRLTRMRFGRIVFPRQTAVQQQVLTHIISLLQPDRRPDLAVALRAIFGVDGTVSFKAASRFIESEWSLKMSDHTFADLWRRMVAALAPSTPTPPTPPTPPIPPIPPTPRPPSPIPSQPDLKGIEGLMAARLSRASALRRSLLALPETFVDQEASLGMLAVMYAILMEESTSDAAPKEADVIRIRRAAQRLAHDLDHL